MVDVRIDASDLIRIERAISAAGPKGRKALARAVRHEGGKALTASRRGIRDDSGLKPRVIGRAVRPKSKALEYEIYARGGYINLAYFGAREEAPGVRAYVRGRAEIWVGAFMKVGYPGERKSSTKLSPLVWNRAGSGRMPIERTDTDVRIPDELVGGKSRDAFDRIAGSDLPKRVAHELAFIMTRG